MGKEGEFSTEYRKPPQSDVERENAENWEKYGKFVPPELRGSVDDMFNLIGSVTLVSIGDLSAEQQEKFLEMVRAYKELTSPEEDAGKKRREIRDAVKKLLR